MAEGFVVEKAGDGRVRIEHGGREVEVEGGTSLIELIMWLYDNGAGDGMARVATEVCELLAPRDGIVQKD